MAEERKTFVFDGKENVSTVFDKMRQSSDTAAKSMLKNNRDIQRASEENIRVLEKELLLRDQLNRIPAGSVQGQRSSVHPAGGSPPNRISGGGGGGGDEILNILKESLSVQREIKAAILATSITEIKADQESDASTMKAAVVASTKDDVPDVPDDPNLPPDDPNQPKNKAGKDKTKEKISKGSGLAASIATSPMFAAAAVAGMIPLIGAGAGMLVGKSLQLAEQEAIARTTVQGIAGGDLKGLTSAVHLGRLESDLLKDQAPVVLRAMGREGAGTAAMQMLSAERGLGVGRDALGTLLQTSVRGGGATDLNSPLKGIMGAFATSGILGKDGTDMSMLPELIGIQNQLQTDQITRLDSIDVGLNTSILRELSDLGGAFKNPTALAQAATAIDSGLRSPSNQFAQALQFGVMSKLNPNASRFELMEMQEGGLQSKGLLRGMMQQAKNMSGGSQDVMMENVKAFFPQLSHSRVRGLTEGFLGGKATFDKEFDALQTDSPVDINARAGKVVSDFERNQTKVNEKLEEFGTAVGKVTTVIIDSIELLSDKLDLPTKAEKNIIMEGSSVVATAGKKEKFRQENDIVFPTGTGKM